MALFRLLPVVAGFRSLGQLGRPRGGVVEVANDAELGRVAHIRTPIRMSAASVTVRAAAPRLGQHTDEALGALGYSAADIEGLRRDGVV